MKAYVKPMMEIQMFAANEVIAACGDKGTHYKFQCTAGSGWSGSVYVETNGTPGWQMTDTRRSSYHACGKEHIASTDDVYLDGYYVPALTMIPIPVKIWTDNNTNTHCSTSISMSDWETTKS